MNQAFDDSEHARRRDLMVERDIAGRGVTDERVLAAMGSVPRERFLPPDMAEFAYEDSPPRPVRAGRCHRRLPGL